jgi:hypothetical protein
MPVTWQDVNEAIPVYLGVGRSASPQQRPEYLVERYGQAKAAEFEPAVKALVDEICAFKIDWSKHTLQSERSLRGVS